MAAPNLFDFATSELSQDAFICWLAAWADPAHRAEDEALHLTAAAFLDRLLEAGGVPRPNAYPSVEVHQQRERVDVLLVVNGDTVVVIEDKKHAKDHSDQLRRYREAVAEQFPGHRVAAVYFKTGDRCDYESAAKAGYGCFGMGKLKNALSALRGHIDYYEGIPTGSKQPGMERILAKYKQITTAPTADVTKALQKQAQALDDAGEFDPDNIQDALRWVLASVARRQGQPAFRQTLLELYGGRCAISGTEVGCVLEAAHIVGYKGKKTNHPANGLLLRSDLHTLFDLRLIAIDSKSMTVLVAPDLDGSVYSEFRGRKLHLPKDDKARPSAKALDKHRAKGGL